MTAAAARLDTALCAPLWRVDAHNVIVVQTGVRGEPDHLVHVDPFAGCTDSCSCPADARGEICWARRQVDAVEGAWGFRRCVECGALARLGRWHGARSTVAIWLCPRSAEHTGHESLVAYLFRAAQGRDEWAIGSHGSWRMR